MATVKSVTIYDDYPNGDLRERRYLVVITTNSLVDEEYILSPVIVPVSDDGTDAANGKLDQLAKNETGPEDIAAEYQDQNDYDRRSLGRAMTIESTDIFYTYLGLFKAMEGRGGANAGQRATYLEIPRAEYDLIANRFNDVEGIAFFLDDAKGQVWEELPPGYE